MIFIAVAVKFRYEVWTTDATEALLNASPLLGLVPKEILSLGKLLLLALGAEYRFECIWVVTCVPRLSSVCHGRGREVLHLFQMEIQLLGDDGKLRHVFLTAAGMGTDEVGDNLLAEIFLAVDAVEQALELMELLEGRLAHEMKHAVAGMLGSHFQPPTDVVADKFAGILTSGLIGFLVLAAVQ